MIIKFEIVAISAAAELLGKRLTTNEAREQEKRISSPSSHTPTGQIATAHNSDLQKKVKERLVALIPSKLIGSGWMGVKFLFLWDAAPSPLAWAANVVGNKGKKAAGFGMCGSATVPRATSVSLFFLSAE
uniref:Uncharacterized protein n=1 Tax=Ditylenchus dipsaci TaxID=166011 RepID=A0A915E1A7_9BILA